jgi:Tol biopolymer transport system component
MTRASLLLTVLVAACGGDSSHKKVDAAVNPDVEGIDAPVDGQVSTVTSRVWAVGDFVADQQPKAGGFEDGATLPFGPTTPPPLVVPAATSVLASGTGYIASALFDASADGSHVAFVADLTTPGTFDLYVALGDGSSPQMLVAGAPNVEIQAVAISPDGTKVAYLADATVNGGYDLYIVNTQGTPAPIKVSPDRPTPDPNQDVFFQVTWSADSRYLAFSADLNKEGVDQPWCVDTNAATPVAVFLLKDTVIDPQTMGAQGVRGALLFDSADNVYFRARVTANGQFDLFQAAPDGGVTMQITGTLPKRTDTTTPDIGAFAINPSGTKIVVSADAPTVGAYDIYLMDTATLTSPEKLTNLAAPGHSDFATPMWFSPDGEHIAFVGNLLSARREPFVLAIGGGGAHRLVSVLTSCAACTSPDADALQWTADGTKLYVLGDLTANNDTKAYRLDPKMTDQTPELAVDVPVSGDLTELVIRRK